MNSSHLFWALTAILGVQAVTDAAVLGIGRREAVLARWLPYLVSGAAGVLLATACLDLLPEAVHATGGGLTLWEVLLLTLLVLFCFQAWAQSLTGEALEEIGNPPGKPDHVHDPRKGSIPFHLHAENSPSVRSKPAALVLGSALHSTVDGVAIVAAFAAGPRAGWSAALAVGLHELPHRMGDFALLVHMGVARRRAAQLAVAAGAMAIVGGLAVALIGQRGATPAWLLPISAGTFLYIALVDLIPELHAHRHGRGLGWQALCLLAGAGLVAIIVHLPGD